MAAGARPAASYDDPHSRHGPEHTLANRLGVLGLLAAGDTRSDSVAKGIRWLLETAADPDGAWDEDASTPGPDFRGSFILRTTCIANYFPLLALTTYRRAMQAGASGSLRREQIWKST